VHSWHQRGFGLPTASGSIAKKALRATKVCRRPLKKLGGAKTEPIEGAGRGLNVCRGEKQSLDWNLRVSRRRRGSQGNQHSFVTAKESHIENKKSTGSNEEKRLSLKHRKGRVKRKEINQIRE